MQWATATWSMAAAACLTLAAMHLLVWFGQRRDRVHLLFSCSATCAAILAFLELGMMNALTPEGFGRVLRAYTLPLSVMILSLVCLVRVYLHAGRVWLAWAIVAGRTLGAILNFASTPNINYRQITAIRRISFLGQPVSLARGTTSPWTLVGQITGLLLVIFVIDAFVTLWRRGERHRALVICGSMAVSL